MNSTKIPQNYANSDIVKYGAHYAELLSDEVDYEHNIGKFILSYLTPNLTADFIDTTLPKNRLENVINRENLGISRITETNYVEIEIPKHLFYIMDIEIKEKDIREYSGIEPEYKSIIKRKTYTKGQKFIITNISGDIDKPCIIGVV